MSLFILIKEIIISLFQLYQKLKKLDDYWSKEIPLTATVSNVHSNWSVQNAYANIIANTINIQVNYKRTAAQLASGTSIKAHLCDLTITGIAGIVPSDKNCLTTSSINSGTGPIVTTHYSNCERVDDDTWTIQIWVDGNAGGVVPQNYEYSFITIFYTGVVRDMSIG